MDANVPYLASVKNLHSILDKTQHAAVPEAFGYDFLKDMGFSSSNDRGIVKIFKYIGFLDTSGKPQAAYRDFVDHTKTKTILAKRLMIAFDDLYNSNKKAHEKTVDDLKGWFKTKTGKGDAVALKMASTFKSLASYADFKNVSHPSESQPDVASTEKHVDDINSSQASPGISMGNMGLVYRLEIHLPDTQNIETFRAIFKAMREELM